MSDIRFEHESRRSMLSRELRELALSDHAVRAFTDSYIAGHVEMEPMLQQLVAHLANEKAAYLKRAVELTSRLPPKPFLMPDDMHGAGK